MTENEQAVREWLASNTRSGVLYRLAEQALALLDAKDVEIAELKHDRDSWEHTALVNIKSSDTALSRAKQAEANSAEWASKAGRYDRERREAEAALAEERKAHQAFREDAADIASRIEAIALHGPIPRGWREKIIDILEPILPAKPDPLLDCLAEVFPGDQEDTRENMAAAIRAAIERAGGTISFERNG